jgi:hypothetical protein
VTEHIAKGTMFVPFNQPGFATNAILAGSFTIAAMVEPVQAVEDAEPAGAVVGGDG